jgi:hypothetical protein
MMPERKTTKMWRWIKEGKGNFIEILIVSIMVSLIIMTITVSQKSQKPQIEASDIYLDYHLNKNTNFVSLYLLNKSQIAANGLSLTIFIPGSFAVKETCNCKLSRKNDSTLTVDFSENTIYPTFSNTKEYPVVDFKLIGVNKNKLEKSEKSIRYIINCDEGEFKGKIPIFYIFTVKGFVD